MNTYQFVNNLVHHRLWHDTINGWPRDTFLHALVGVVGFVAYDGDTSMFFHTIPPPFIYV